jgi:hypothetical protein
MPPVLNFSGEFTGSSRKPRRLESELSARPEKLSRGPEKLRGGESGSETLLPSAAPPSSVSTSDEQSERIRRRIRSSASSTATAYLAPKATGGKAAGLAPATHRRTPRLLLRGGEVEVEPLRGRTEAEHAAVD